MATDLPPPPAGPPPVTRRRRRWPWILAVAVAVVIAAAAAGSPVEEADPDTVAAASSTTTTAPATTRPSAPSTTTSTAPPAPTTTAPPTIGDGTYIVGSEVAPGRYVTDGPPASSFAGSCYWARLSGFSGAFEDLITNGIVDGPGVVEILPGDVGFETSGGCEWRPGG